MNLRTLGRLIPRILLLCALPSLPAEILYTVTDLGMLGGCCTNGTAINNVGQVTGSSRTSGGNDHAFLYSNGQITDLGTLPGDTSSFASGISDNGQVVGSSTVSTGTSRGFLYSNGQMVDLGPDLSGASDINNAGQIVGPFGVYSNGEITRLVPLPGPGRIFSASATAINNVGQVTGITDLFSGGNEAAARAFLYSNGQMIDVFPLAGPKSIGLGINDAGDIVGSVYDPSSGSNAFLYGNGQARSLFDSSGYSSNGATAINNAGQVVGWAGRDPQSQHRERAFLYSNGQMTDLNDLIDPALGITLTDAIGISDNGQIVANGPNHAFLLTPVPEPSRFVLFGIVLLGLWAWSRHPMHLFR